VTRALVVGCAAGVWEEVAAAQAMAEFDAVYCIKMAGINWPTAFDYWVTLHPEFMDNYKAQRAALELPGGYQVVAPPVAEVGMHGEHKVDRRVSYKWKDQKSSGSSGLYAVKVALDDGHDRVVIVGVPMVAESGHFARGKPWLQCELFKAAWPFALPIIKDKVRSTSGWTNELLGGPTAEWLAQAREAHVPVGVRPDPSSEIEGAQNGTQAHHR